MTTTVARVLRLWIWMGEAEWGWEWLSEVEYRRLDRQEQSSERSLPGSGRASELACSPLASPGGHQDWVCQRREAVRVWRGLLWLDCAAPWRSIHPGRWTMLPNQKTVISAGTVQSVQEVKYQLCPQMLCYFHFPFVKQGQPLSNGACSRNLMRWCVRR